MAMVNGSVSDGGYKPVKINNNRVNVLLDLLCENIPLSYENKTIADIRMAINQCERFTEEQFNRVPKQAIQEWNNGAKVQGIRTMRQFFPELDLLNCKCLMEQHPMTKEK